MSRRSARLNGDATDTRVMCGVSAPALPRAQPGAGTLCGCCPPVDRRQWRTAIM
ncbi:hypothetical protein [Azospirillum palustre]